MGTGISDPRGRGHYLHGVTQVRYDAATSHALGPAHGAPTRSPRRDTSMAATARHVLVATLMTVAVVIVGSCSNPNFEQIVGIDDASPGAGSDEPFDAAADPLAPTTDEATADGTLGGLLTGAETVEAVPTLDEAADGAVPAPTAVFDSEEAAVEGSLPSGAYVVARDGAGRQVPGARGPASILPVYDEPEGPARSLVYTRPDRSTLPYPLVDPSFFGNDLVLRVVDGIDGDEWLQVQAPIRPALRHVWVQASDFVWFDGDQRIEVDLGDSTLRAFADDERVLSSRVAYGSADTPTPLGVSYLSEIIQGAAGASGPIFNLALFSDTSPSTGAALPAITLLGTTDRSELGEAITRGTLRVPTNVMNRLNDALDPGALVIIYDSSDAETDRGAILGREWAPAETTAP